MKRPVSAFAVARALALLVSALAVSASCFAGVAQGYGSFGLRGLPALVFAESAHDVAITGVVSSRTAVGQGFSDVVNVTAANEGSSTETFNVTAYCNPPGVVGYWALDQGAGTMAYDSSCYRNHGTIYGASWTSGKANGALSFDGVNDYVDCGNSATLDPTDEATIQAWVRIGQLPSTAGHIMAIAGRSGAGTDLDLQVETDNRFKFYVGAGYVAVSNTVAQTDRWYHIAGTYQAANNVKVYINGTLEKTTLISITRAPNPGKFCIGQSGFWPGRFFNGTIDEVGIYDRALSAEEIEADYMQTGTRFSSQTQVVTLDAGTVRPVTFTWDTEGLTYGNYALSAFAEPVAEETDLEDNTLVGGELLITLPGDVNGDRDVNIFDVVTMADAYQAKYPNPRYNPNCDIDGDGDIDIFDIVIAAGHYGDSW